MLGLACARACMVSMLASTYQMDDEDTLPYLRMHTFARYQLDDLTCRAQHGKRPTQAMTLRPTIQCSAAGHEQLWRHV